jgi:hypothetical protein
MLMDGQRERTRLEHVLGVRLATDAVRQWPQSGEQITSRARIAAAESHFIGLRLGISRRLQVGNTLVVEWTIDYGDGRLYWNVSIAELRGGKAVRVTDYWGEPSSPPDRRIGHDPDARHAVRSAEFGRRSNDVRGPVAAVVEPHSSAPSR